MPSLVGTLDVLGLAVYARANGSIYFNKNGVRNSVHSNTRWTTTDRIRMRGNHPLPDTHPLGNTLTYTHDSEYLDALLGNREQEDLEMAIATSLQYNSPANLTGVHVENNAVQENSPLCVVCLATSVDHMIRACNHACVCAACARRLTDACPICREPITCVERIWLA